MNAEAVISLLSVLARIVEEVRTMRAKGVTDEEIRYRLASPGGVAQDLIDAISDRENLFADPFAGDAG